MNTRNAALWFNFASAVILSLALIALVCAVSGCKSFYENAGTRARMGSIRAPIEVSEPTSSVNIRALYTMDGIDFYAGKNCIAQMDYSNTYTNSFGFGLWTYWGIQRGGVVITPTENTASEANASQTE